MTNYILSIKSKPFLDVCVLSVVASACFCHSSQTAIHLALSMIQCQKFFCLFVFKTLHCISFHWTSSIEWY